MESLFPFINATDAFNPAFFPSFLAFSTSGQSLFLATLSSCVRSSRIWILFCFKSLDRLTAVHIASRHVWDRNCTMMCQGFALPYFGPSRCAMSTISRSFSAVYREIFLNNSTMAILTFSPSRSGILATRRLLHL